MGGGRCLAGGVGSQRELELHHLGAISPASQQPLLFPRPLPSRSGEGILPLLPLSLFFRLGWGRRGDPGTVPFLLSLSWPPSPPVVLLDILHGRGGDAFLPTASLSRLGDCGGMLGLDRERGRLSSFPSLPIQPRTTLLPRGLMPLPTPLGSSTSTMEPPNFSLGGGGSSGGESEGDPTVVLPATSPSRGSRALSPLGPRDRGPVREPPPAPGRAAGSRGGAGDSGRAFSPPSVSPLAPPPHSLPLPHPPRGAPGACTRPFNRPTRPLFPPPRGGREHWGGATNIPSSPRTPATPSTPGTILLFRPTWGTRPLSGGSRGRAQSDSPEWRAQTTRPPSRRPTTNSSTPPIFFLSRAPTGAAPSHPALPPGGPLTPEGPPQASGRGDPARSPPAHPQAPIRICRGGGGTSTRPPRGPRVGSRVAGAMRSPNRAQGTDTLGRGHGVGKGEAL